MQVLTGAQLRASGHPVEDGDLARLSPLATATSTSSAATPSDRPPSPGYGRYATPTTTETKNVKATRCRSMHAEYAKPLLRQRR